MHKSDVRDILDIDPFKNNCVVTFLVSETQKERKGIHCIRAAHVEYLTDVEDAPLAEEAEDVNVDEPEQETHETPESALRNYLLARQNSTMCPVCHGCGLWPEQIEQARSRNCQS